jgi:predicted nucleotidyltransferase
MNFGLSELEFKILDDILLKPLKNKGAKVWIFGSRARGTQKPFSDIDIMYAISSNIVLPDGFLFEIKEKLDDSNLPFKVDLVDEKEIAQSYKPGALKDRIEI